MLRLLQCRYKLNFISFLTVTWGRQGLLKFWKALGCSRKICDMIWLRLLKKVQLSQNKTTNDLYFYRKATVYTLKPCVRFLHCICLKSLLVGKDNILISAVISVFQFAAASAKSLQLCPTLCDPIDQAPPSLGFSRQEHWSGLPLPSPMHESEK